MTKSKEHALLAIFTISLVATLGSLYFSEVRKFEPCTFCWYQRIMMYPLVLLSAIAIIEKNGRIFLTTAIFSFIGGCISLYHYSLQKIPFIKQHPPACGDVPCTAQYVNYAGFITIPFMALIAFSLIFLLSVLMKVKFKD